MIWFLFTVAFGQGLIELVNDGCVTHEPLAGSAGYENARSALRTTVATYGAGAFARRRLRGKPVFAVEMHSIYNVARVPHYCASQGKFGGTIYEQPYDLGSTTYGLRVPLLKENSPVEFDLFYAASAISGTTLAGWASFTLPLYNVYPVLTAPVFNGSIYDGVGAFAVEWIGGARFSSEVLTIQAGYTKRRGLYLDVTQDKLGLFGNGIIEDIVRYGVTAKALAYAMGGVQQLDAQDFGAPQEVGMSSAFFRVLPQGKSDPDSDSGLDEVMLKTFHVAQQDLGGYVDLNVTTDWGRGFTPRDIGVAVHTRGYHSRFETDVIPVYGRVGIILLPEQPLYGVRGGIRPSLDLRIGGTSREKGTGFVSLKVNEPEVLDLYPYAYNAVSISFVVAVNPEDM